MPRHYLDPPTRRLVESVSYGQPRATRRPPKAALLPTRGWLTKRNHYSPSFSNRYWAGGADRKVRVYSLGVDERVTHRVMGYKQWGREDFLYTPSLERYLSLVETDAQGPYQKLLDTVPFSEADRRKWVAFLATQLLRTPSFLARNLAGLRHVIQAQGLAYPTDIASLRRAYATLFNNDEVFRTMYGWLDARRWRLLEPPPGRFFVRPDNPAVVVGALSKGTWRLAYPLTPTCCFMAGPDAPPEQKELIPPRDGLSEPDWEALIRHLAAAIHKSAIAPLDGEDAAVRALLAENWGASTLDAGSPSAAAMQYWGGLLS